MPTQRPDTIRAAAYATALTLAASTLPVFAHHVMGGQMPQTFGEGLLSGVGHPLIDIGHFAFVVAVGITAALTGRIWTLTLAFVAGTLAGCFVHLAGITLPVAELVIAATVLLLGAIIATNRELPSLMLAIMFAAAGLFHGWAYGGSIIGAEPTPLNGYLLGFTLIQLLVAVIAARSTRWVIAGEAATRTKVRLAGAVVAGIGVALFIGQIGSVLISERPAVAVATSVR